MSKSESDTRCPDGPRGVSFPVESRIVRETAVHPPIGSMLTFGCIVTIHAPLVLEPDASHPGGFPLLAPAMIGVDTDVVNDTPGTRTFGAIHLLGYVAVTVATVPTGAFGQAHTAKLLAPSYFPTAARAAGAVTLKSKSDIEMSCPFGPRGDSPFTPLRSSETALHSPTASALRVIVNDVVHGPRSCARALERTSSCGSKGKIKSAVRIRAPIQCRDLAPANRWPWRASIRACEMHQPVESSSARPESRAPL
jgi:hypothetical protein